MVQVQSFDTSGLNQFVGVFSRVLGITSEQAVKYQTGLLMGDIVKDTPPKTLQKANNKANFQVRQSFYTVKRGADVKQFGGNKPLFAGEQAKGKDTVWLYASPSVIVGTPKKFDKRGVSASQMMAMHKIQQARPGSKWEQKGERKSKGKYGHQNIMMVNKPVVRASEAKKLARMIRDKFGKLRASFMKGAAKVAAKISAPSFVRKHVGDSKGDFKISPKNSVSPFTIIISQSPGCEAPQVQKIVRGAQRKRLASLKKDIQLFLMGTKNAGDFRRKHGF